MLFITIDAPFADFISSNRSSWHLYTEKQWSTSFVMWSLNHPSMILRFLAPAPVPLCLSLSLGLFFSANPSSPGACASRFRTGLPWSMRASTPSSSPYPNYCLYDIESRIKLAINATARPKPQTGHIELNISCVQIVIWSNMRIHYSWNKISDEYLRRFKYLDE